MKIDNYTRFLLTITCLCLIYLCLRDLSFPKVHADAPVRVILVSGENHPIGYGPYFPLEVEVQNH